ncbi:MAG TPA: hypothetical protein VHY08_27405 [Bacillota bacterium]|nr:hypothetical protein [Bacillota bacterium]
MRNKFLTVILVFVVLLSVAVTAQGEFSLDSVLVQINSSGRNDFGYFRTQISLTYNVPQTRVNYYYTSLRMAPADIYMTMELASICRVQPERVVTVYRVHRSRGWGYIAREFGVKPGSREYRRLMDRGNSMHQKMKNKKSKGPKVYNIYNVYDDDENDESVKVNDYRDQRNR